MEPLVPNMKSTPYNAQIVTDATQLVKCAVCKQCRIFLFWSTFGSFLEPFFYPVSAHFAFFLWVGPECNGGRLASLNFFDLDSLPLPDAILSFFKLSTHLAQDHLFDLGTLTETSAF